ncbi:MAG: hypothetical protein GF398_09045 [Chitinivibrionales bacterium]|nr:hypothetical protein [Chitinivibrionales bacterium]
MKNRHMNLRGITVIELLVAIVIAAVVTSGALYAYRNFTQQQHKQKARAELETQLQRIRLFVEKDLRMAGYGLSGNGLLLSKETGSPDMLTILSNQSATETQVNSGLSENRLSFDLWQAEGIEAGTWMQIDGSEILYRRIESITFIEDEGYRVVLNEAIPENVAIIAGDQVKFYDGVKYWVNAESAVMYRQDNTLTQTFEGIENFGVVPWDASGTDVSGEVGKARTVDVSFSGDIAWKDQSFELSEDISVNLRNYF